MTAEILHRDDLPLGGFAGLKEHRLVMDHRVGGGKDTWDGLGNFVYLADARYLPKGDTRMHAHKEIDVISVVLEGKLVHEGSIEHGRSMIAGQAQAQRAGGEGFSHNEINPDNARNRMIQLWVLPETHGEPASYKFYDLEKGKINRIYGGPKEQHDTLDSHTILEVGLLDAAQSVARDGDFLAYITGGGGQLNGRDVIDGDLVRGTDLNFQASDDGAQVIIITTK